MQAPASRERTGWPQASNYEWTGATTSRSVSATTSRSLGPRRKYTYEPKVEGYMKKKGFLRGSAERSLKQYERALVNDESRASLEWPFRLCSTGWRGQVTNVLIVWIGNHDHRYLGAQRGQVVKWRTGFSRFERSSASSVFLASTVLERFAMSLCFDALIRSHRSVPSV